MGAVEVDTLSKLILKLSYDSNKASKDDPAYPAIRKALISAYEELSGITSKLAEAKKKRDIADGIKH